MYSSRSWAYQESGQLSLAGNYVLRAVTIHETLNDRLSLARSENNLGLLYFKRGQLPQAFEHANRALRLFEESGVETGKANVLMSLCEMHMAQSDFEQARSYASDALAAATNSTEPANMAEAHVWLGRIAAAQQDDAVA